MKVRIWIWMCKVYLSSYSQFMNILFLGENLRVPLTNIWVQTYCQHGGDITSSMVLHHVTQI